MSVIGFPERPPVDQFDPKGFPRVRVQFPAGPLLSGTVWETNGFVLKDVAEIRLVVTTEDGSEHDYPLKFGHNGWWDPRALAKDEK